MDYLNKNRKIELKYLNEKRLGVHDFIESIKTDLLFNISKNRGYNDEVIDFEICYTDNNNKSYFCFRYNIKKI